MPTLLRQSLGELGEWVQNAWRVMFHPRRGEIASGVFWWIYSLGVCIPVTVVLIGLLPTRHGQWLPIVIVALLLGNLIGVIAAQLVLILPFWAVGLLIHVVAKEPERQSPPHGGGGEEKGGDEAPVDPDTFS